MKFLSLLFLLLTIPAWAREPLLREVQEETVRSLEMGRGDWEGWKKRARWSYAMPRLQVGFDRQLRDVVSLTTSDSVSISGGDVFVGPSTNDFDQDVQQGTRFEVTALWQLNELVFNRDSLAASHEQREWIRERTRALQEVTEAYGTRKRLLEDLRSGGRGESPALRERKRQLLDQSLGVLDARTNGWFSSRLGE